MLKLIRELRRREVFRSTGLYIGGVWIVLQVADIVLPAYDAPDWVFRALITVAIIGFPIAVALAWTFDLSSRGISFESDVEHDDTRLSFGRKADFLVIGVLLVALAGSLFANFAPREPVVMEDIEPVSILIADFANQTGDSVFDGSLEQAFTMGIEVSSFITAFDRTTASNVLAEIDEGSTLDTAGARSVSVREGVSIVVGGALTADGDDYELSVEMVNPDDGAVLASFSETAKGKTEVLSAVADLARSLREELGDVNVDKSAEGEETFTTISLEAMHDYVEAQRLARDGRDDEAISLYRSAVESDPDFGRAWSGLALSADKLGKTDIAKDAWPNALRLLEGMTERERYRTAGAYYSTVTRNSQKAIENYEMLVSKYPADDSGHNNLAFAYFLDLQFGKALEAGKKVVEIYPTKAMYHANYSLYAMYAGDLEAARTAAAKTLKLNPNYHKAYLPYAVAALVEGDLEAARVAYQNMALTGPRGASLANIGVADMLLWSGDAEGAEAVLLEGLATDEEHQNSRGLATKKMMLAYALLRQGSGTEEVTARIEESLAISVSMSQLVPAALMHVDMGNLDVARDIAAELGGRLEGQQRAYAKMINALLKLQAKDNIGAIEELQAAVAMADLWLIRFFLGTAYVEMGHYAEAVSEFTMCRERLGEAFSMFLDDTPTFRYTAELDEWSARARDSMTAGS